ncbi:hypothetical protein [Streptomyces sp. NPDC004291]
MGGPRRAGAAWLAAGVLLAAVGGGVVAVGTGAPGLETRTFTRIACHEQRTAKGGSVWHCSGMTAGQIAAAGEDLRRAAEDALHAHDPAWPRRPSPPDRRTRLSFVDHDGREDPAEVTATRFGSRWIAHGAGVAGTGAALLLAGAGAGTAGVLRLRDTRGARGAGGSRDA